MAAEGFRLVIPQEMLNRLTLADEKLERLGKTGERTQERIIASFKAMADGIQPFLDKLTQAQQALANIGNFKGGNINLGNISVQATQSADAVNNLVDAIINLTKENNKLQGQQLSARGITIAQEGQLSKKESLNEYRRLSNDLKELINEELQRGRLLNQQNKKNIADNRVYNEQVKRGAQEQIENENKLTLESKKRKDERNREYQITKKQADEAAKLSRLQTGTKSAPIVNYERAMQMSEQTINARIKKIERLKSVLQELQNAEGDHAARIDNVRSKMQALSQENKRVKKSLQKVKGSFSGLMNTTQQLARSLALMFSVSQITGYVKKLIEVRGEFELQQTALRGILQNKEQADEIYQKTIDLAVNSPYRIRDLIGYTKQLAAYRIENEKLYDTTKRLADISSGLGVDMQRLILAYGQVQAATFLRATELRQFTEAGIPMLDELARYFSELEDRMVTTGDVMSRISKRAVEFKDVENVIKRMTDKGGVFFEMQEKQSKTLRGQWLNMFDQIDLMLNDIGQSNAGLINDMISLMRNLIKGWRNLVPIVKSIMAFFAAKAIVGVGKAIWGIGTYIVRAVKHAKLLQVVLASISRIGWGGIVGAIAAIGFGLYELFNTTSKINEDFLRIDNEMKSSLEESIGTYVELTNILKDATKTTKEREEAVTQLKRQYSEILPSYMLEIDYIKSMKDGYDEVNDVMMLYYDNLAKEKKKSAVKEKYSDDIYGDDGEIAALSEYIYSLRKRRGALQDYIDLQLTQDQIAKVIGQLVSDVERGDVKLSEFNEKLIEYLERVSGKEIPVTLFGQIRNQAEDLLDVLQKIQSATGAVEGIAILSPEEQTLQNRRNVYAEFWESQKKAIEGYVSAYASVIDAQKDYTQSEEDEKDAKKKVYDESIKDLQLYISKIKGLNMEASKATLTQFGLTKDGANLVPNGAFNTWQDMIKLRGRAEKDVINFVAKKEMQLSKNKDGWFGEPIFVRLIEKMSKERTKINSFQASLIHTVESLESKGHTLGNILSKIYDSETAEKAAEKVKKEMDVLESTINRYEKIEKKGVVGTHILDVLLLPKDFDIEEERKKLKDLNELWEALGGGKDEKKKKTSNEIFEERLRVIKEIYKAYQELSKTFDDITSKEGAMKKFGDAFKAAWGRTPQEMGFDLFSEEGVKKAFDHLISLASDANDKVKGELAKGEFVLEGKIKIQQQSDKDLIDEITDMFSGYELSLELQKLNIPPNLAKQLFNVDTFDLSEIRSKIEKDLADAVKTGGRSDIISELKKQLEKVEEMERKAQEERLKTYSKYLVKGMDERVRIKLEELRKLEEVEKDKDVYTEEQRIGIRKSIQKEAQEALDKNAWEEFKKSDIYISLFEDLNKASNQSLDIMIDRLNNLRKSLSELPATQLKEIVTQLEKAKNELDERNPFKKFANDINLFFGNIGGKGNAESGIKELGEQLKIQSGLIEQQEDVVAMYERKLESGQEMTDEEKLQLENARAYLRILKNQKTTLESQQTTFQKVLDDIKKGAVGIGDAFVDSGKFIQEVGSFVDDISGKWESAFGLSDTAKADLEMISGVAKGLGETLSSVGQGIMTGDWLSAGMGAVSGIMSIASTLGQAHDKRKERQIESEIKLVERLKDLYEDLGKTIENAYSLDTLNEATEMSKENIIAQINATERMISAEKDKKKTDNDRIDEWKKNIEELKDTYRELEETRLQELGAFASDDNKKSSAEAFVDAWIQAYKETGDGLIGLNEQFDEFFEDMVKKQLLQRGTQKYLDDFFTKFDKTVDEISNGTKAPQQGISEILSEWQSTSPELNSFLEKLAEALGVAGEIAESTSGLGGLQAGISGITEEQADVLAAYWSSVRLYTADTNAKVNELVSKLFGEEVDGNPILAELRAQTAFVREIRDVLSGVVRGGHTMGGQGLKVFVS